MISPRNLHSTYTMVLPQYPENNILKLFSIIYLLLSATTLQHFPREKDNERQKFCSDNTLIQAAKQIVLTAAKHYLMFI